MPRFDRRHFLKLSLGASQFALLSSAGLLSSPSAWASNSLRGPKKLLTLYVPGGWQPMLFFQPLNAAGIRAFIPPNKPFGNGNQGKEPAFFDPEHVTNLDGSGDAMAQDDASRQRVRTTKFWDEQAVEAGDYENAANRSLNGYAWRYYELWKKMVVIHGVDQGTAAHESGIISAMSGAAGSSWRSPAIHAWVANALHDAYGEDRILGSVSIGRAPFPNDFNLAHAKPTYIRGFKDMERNFSERSDLSWRGLRDMRDQSIDRDVRGNLLNVPIDATRIEARTLKRLQALSQSSRHAPDTAMLENLWETYGAVSKQLANDLVSQLERTTGWRDITDEERATRSRKFPHWQTDSRFGPMFVTTGLTYLGAGQPWADSFELGLKLLKSGLTSAVSVHVPPPAGDASNFDTHNAASLEGQCVTNRGVLEAIGRLLGEMDTTPGIDDPNGTLLDETLVMVCSEFSRTWPKSGNDDHHPSTSVMLIGGGMQGNQMIGNYDIGSVSPNSLGPLGSAVEFVDRNHSPIGARMPRSADVIHTALHVMGIEEFDIVGGSSLIKGVLS